MAENDWRSALPEDLKNEAMFKDIPDVSTLAKVARDLRTVQAQSLRVPGPDASDADRAAFREKLTKAAPDLVEIPKDPEARAKVEDAIFEQLGRPKDAKEYAPPADLALPEEVVEALRASAREEGLTRKQFNARAKQAADAYLKASNAEKEELAQLRKELGDAFDERVALAKSVAQKLGVPKEALAQMPAQQVRVWANVAKAIGGEAAQVGTQASASGKLTTVEHSARANEIRARLMKERLGADVREALLNKLVEHETAVATALEQQ